MVMNRSKSLLLVVIALAALALAAGGYWFVRNRNPGTIASQPSAVEKPSASAAPVDVPVVKAIEEGRVDDARQLLQEGANINAANSDGTTALMRAAEGSAYLPNNTPAVAMLLEKGASLDTQDKQGRTALYRAAAEGQGRDRSSARGAQGESEPKGGRRRHRSPGKRHLRSHGLFEGLARQWS